MIPMYEIAVMFVITLMCFAVIPNLIVTYEHFCKWLIERRELKKLRTSLETDYQTWYTIAVNESDPTEKGYAIARLIIIKNELEVRK